MTSAIPANQLRSAPQNGAYETVIGLECHVQLATASKMFCGCSPDYAGAQPNTHVCPVCLGMPGVLPVINRRAVELTVMTGLALGSEIPESTKFDRKNYPYPDLVKGYQISQYDLPLVRGGAIEVAVEKEGPTRWVELERVHLEEDTGKLTHVGDGQSLVDFNRAGVALMEMVTRPEIRSSGEARAFLQKLRGILRTLGVSSADMEKGQLRCDVNVSLRPVGSEVLGTKVEVKNLNSFRAVHRALEYEIERQTDLLTRGERIVQETRGWVEDRGVTVSQRTKEQAHDYRYFSEPDLPPLFLDRDWVARLKAALPELPDARAARYARSFGLSSYDAQLLSGDVSTAAFFDATVAAGADPKKAANWILNDLARLRAAADGEEGGYGKLLPEHLAQTIRMVDRGTVSGGAARQLLESALASGREPSVLVEELGLAQVSDAGELEEVARSVLEAHPGAVADYRSGKETAMNFLKGQIMRATRGKANPAVAEELLKKLLG